MRISPTAAALILPIAFLATPLTAAPPPTPDPIERQIADAVAKLDGADHNAGAAQIKSIGNDLEAALAKEPNDARRQFLLGRCRFFLEDDLNAAAAYDRAIALAPDEPEYHFMKGVLLQYQKDSDGAIRELSAATKLAPKQGKYWFELGTALARTKDQDGALAAFRKTVELDPANAKAMLMAGTILLDQNKTTEAIELMKKAAAADPRYLLPRYNLGQTYQTLAQPEDALKWFQDALKIQPDDYRIRAKVIQVLQDLGRIKDRDEQRQALFDLHKAGKVDPPFYCREQFREGKEKLMVFEYFALQGERAQRYSFQVLDDTGAKPKYKLSLGSYEMTTRIAREAGHIGADQRMFHLDAYYPDGEHRTYGMFKTEPTYEETRQMVVDVLNGKRKPLSSLVPGKN